MRIVILSLSIILLGGCGRSNDAAMKDAPMASDQPAAAPSPEALPPTTTTTASATVQLAATQGNMASGELTLTAEGAGVQIVGTVSGLAPNSEHGFHIHEKGDCSAPDASSAGEHFSPLGKPHGAPGAESHVGDLGNITADASGVARVNVRAATATWRSGAATDIAGKAIIVHAGADDLKSQPAGDAGDRIACGVIS